MKRISYLFFCIVIINLGGANLNAEELTAVRIDANYPPFEMVVNDTLTGLHIDLVNAVAKRVNIKINFKSVPWKRAINMVDKEKADAITYIGKSAEREKFLYYNDGNILSSSAYGLMMLKNRSKEIKFTGDLKALNNYKIGILRGYSYGSDFDKADNFKKHIVDKADVLIKLLHNGRVDLIVIDETKFLQSRTNDMWSDSVFLKPVLTRSNFYIAFSKANQPEKMANDFAKEMTAFKQTQEFQEILAKYKLN